MPPLDPQGTYFWRDSFFPINGVWLMDKRFRRSPRVESDPSYRAFIDYNDEGLVRLVGDNAAGFALCLSSGLYTLHDTLDEAVVTAIARDRLLSR